MSKTDNGKTVGQEDIPQDTAPQRERTGVFDKTVQQNDGM